MRKKDFEEIVFVLLEIWLLILAIAGAAAAVAIAVSMWKGGAA